MDFDYSPKVQDLRKRLAAFMDEHVYPNEQRFHDEVGDGDRWEPTKVVEELKARAKAAGLWNLFLPASERGAGLTNTEYAPLCEIMGRVGWAPEAFNCSAPDTGNMEVLRHLPVFGYDDAPHGHMEVEFKDVRVPASNMLLGEGRGFEIAQGRLGPGRIHHCMRLIGVAERALEKMCRRTKSRVAFGRPISDQGVTLDRIARSRIMIDEARLLTLKAAWMMDTVGNKAARAEIAMIKVAAPIMACHVLDCAIQAHGAAGICDDFGLAHAYANARTLRLADGPHEVHLNQIGRLQLPPHSESHRAPAV